MIIASRRPRRQSSKLQRSELPPLQLSLGKMARAAASTTKKAKHYVWISEETGTHIGGGRWVAVEDDVNGTTSNPVEKRDGQMLNQPQSQQLRPFTGPNN